MRKWWWWWVPGFHKRWKLEKRRASALVFIEGERASVQQMKDRPNDPTNDIIDGNVFNSIMAQIAKAEEGVRTTSDYDRIVELMDIAEGQAQLRAYLCPHHEISVEASLSLGLLQEWSVPKSMIDNLHRLLDSSLQNSAQNPADARSALRAVFDETDSWDDYTVEHADDMRKFTRILFGATMVMIGCAIALLQLLHYNWVTPVALLLAGASGSCVSVMTKMPEGVSLSGQLDSLERRILSRMAFGIVGSLVVSGFLSWGLISISIHGQTFGDLINSSGPPGNVCNGALRTLILIAVPMLFGFSERALASVEETVFGKVKKSRVK